jgi:NAD(P)-dependent dehydrogenase (short-subunit alcohol dehydrogenase family)
MDLWLQSKVALVAGATGTLGEAICHALAAEGARLALVGRSPQKLAVLEQSLLARYAVEARAIVADLEINAAAEAGIESTLQQFGRLDVLVAAAGAARGGVFTELDDAAWRSSLELKLFGTIRLLRAAIPVMARQKSGRIVVIAGNAARHPEARMLPGAAANAALLAIVQGLAEELGPLGVAINAVNPGPVRSPRWTSLIEAAATREGRPAAEVEARFLEKTPLRRLATPEEVAQHVVFLASERAAHMTGMSITVDGGATRGSRG